MVTVNGKQKPRKKHVPKKDIQINMQPYISKIIFGAIAVISIFVVLNALFSYPHVQPSTPYKTPESDPLFASAQKTPSPLVTDVAIDKNEENHYMVLTFNVSNTDNATLAKFECSVDMSKFTACKGPMVVETNVGINHTLEVRAVDTKGNVEDQPAAVMWD